MAVCLTLLALPDISHAQGSTVKPPPAPVKITTPGKRPYSAPMIGAMEDYEAIHEDTFIALARTHNLGYVELRAANQDIDPWIPGAGTMITLPKQHLIPRAPRNGIIVNLPEMRLYMFDPVNNTAPITHPVGIGRDGLQTPTGSTKIIRKTEGPTWYPTARMREEDPELPHSVPAGDDNPLGTHALYLDWPTYLIHGTNKPGGIGRRVSSGCIRMYPEDIITLYKATPENMPVHIINQPIKTSWVNDDLYIEAHPDFAGADILAIEPDFTPAPLSREEYALILDVAGEKVDTLDWQQIHKVINERKGYPIKIEAN